MDEAMDIDFFPTVSKAFFFLELRTGSLVIAILEFLMPFIFVGYQSWEYVFGQRYDQFGVIYYPAKWAYFVWIILHVTFIVTAVLVMVAFAQDDKRSFLFTAVAIQLVLLIVYAVMAAVGYILLLLEEWYMHATFFIITRLVLLIFFGYFVIVLNSWLKIYNKH